MQVKTPSCPRQRHLLSQLHKRKVYIPFGAMCRDSMSTQVWNNVLSHYRCSWRNLFLPFFSFWNAGKNAQSSSSTTSAQPASQTEGICTILHIPFGAICRDYMSTQVWCHVLRQYSFRWRNLSVSFFFFLVKCKVKRLSRPRQKLFQQYHIL